MKLSIRALNFNRMIVDKHHEKDPNALRRVSLLSRASSLAAASQNGESAKKNFDRNSKLLNTYLMQPPQRESHLYMSGIDERDEYEEQTFDALSPPHQSKHHSKNSSSRPSQINQYNFQSKNSTPNENMRRVQNMSSKSSPGRKKPANGQPYKTA